MSKRRGSITFEADGKSYALRFGANQMAEAEDALGLPFGQIVDRLQADGKSARFGDLRALFAVAAGVKPEVAGDLMDAISITEASRLLGETIKAAFPDAEGDEGNGASQKQT